MKKRDMISKKVRDGHFPAKHVIKPAKKLANECVNPARRDLRSPVAVYLEKFCYFFSRGFFVQKAFETLYSEFKPEHVGFRKVGLGRA